MNWFYWDSTIKYIIGSVFSFIFVIAVIWAIVKIVRAICKTSILKTKIKYFGTSQEYEDFKAWRKSQSVDTSERSDEG